MSPPSPTKGWTDRQRLAYYFTLVEHSNVKLDFTNSPRPPGKSIGACRIMVDRLKGTLKAELEALRSGHESGGSDAPGKKPAETSRKRKVEVDGTLTSKRGRKAKSGVATEEEEEKEGGGVGVVGVKSEPKEEEDF
ncbi:hypothetical protein BDW02DRAFT_624245 [Decorospora gaudefroyi]|uniref:Uncharacterized protein n=1 Tax=Decorospora gaudefroyi TaxID=184978 RepID=A0A6A5KCZ3_9PLEO|nr:hypothetical protein BDW02DRAFT_624245 [Decorospora gaudefroyi]